MRKRVGGFFLVSILFFWVGAPALAQQYCSPNLPREAPDGRFIDYGDGTVADKRTGLVWKKCLEGVSGEDCEIGAPLLLGWGDALERGVGSSWRLPNVKELSGILDRSCTRPALNHQLFPGDRAVTVWTATPFAKNMRVWVMDIYNLVNTTVTLQESHAVWLVKDPADK